MTHIACAFTYFEDRCSQNSVERRKSTVRKPSGLSAKLANDLENRPMHSPPDERKWRRTMSGKAVLENVRRYRTIASLYRQTAAFRPDQNGRSWGKHLSMSVSPERSSKDTSPFKTPHRDGRWQPLRKTVKAARRTSILSTLALLIVRLYN